MIDFTLFDENLKKMESEKNKCIESNEFKKDYDETKVIDISQSIIIRKKPRKELLSDETNLNSNTKKSKEENLEGEEVKEEDKP